MNMVKIALKINIYGKREIIMTSLENLNFIPYTFFLLWDEYQPCGQVRANTS